MMTSRVFFMSSLGAIFGWFAVGLSSAQELVLTSEELSNKALRTESGAIAGDVRALILDPDLGSVRLVVIELAGPTGRTVAIPWSSLTVRRDGSFWLSVPLDDLLRARPYGLPPAGSTGSPLPGTATSAAIYAPLKVGSVRFDSSRIGSYRGRVVGTIIAPLQGGVDVIVAIIDVGTDEIRAHLGPQNFLEGIGLDITPGQSVVVEGSASESDGRKIVVASRVEVGERAFRLRNSDGTPLWR